MFSFFASTPLIVQQSPAHRVLVVIPVQRECCSALCDSSARVPYSTAAMSSTLAPARPGVDFVEARGTVLFNSGQERALVAVEILPVERDDLQTLAQRGFAVVLDAPIHSPAQSRVSAEIVVESAAVLPGASSGSETAVVILVAVGVLLLVAFYWFRSRCAAMPHKPHAFEYKVLLRSRRHSGASEEMRDALAATSRIKSGIRRMVRRAGSFKNWKAVVEPRKQGVPHVVAPELEDIGDPVEELGDEKEGSEGVDEEPELELREHLAAIQSARPRQ